MVLSVIVLLALPIIAYLVLRWKQRRFYQISAELPGPVSYPLIGSAHLFIGKTNEELFAILNGFVKTYSSPCRGWLGPKLFVFIDNPEDIQVVLNSPNCLEKAEIYRFIRSLNGLFTSPVSIWKVHRKLLSPCFSPVVLSSFISKFNLKSATLVQHVGKNIGRAEYDSYGDISRCTLDMICATFLGTDMNLQSKEGTEFIKNVEDGCELINYRLHRFWLHPEWIYRLTKYYRTERKCFENVFNMLNKIWKKRQKVLSESRAAPLDESISTKKPLIFIDQIQRLAEETQVFDEIDIRDELSTIIVAGNETSALSLSNTILMLAIHQDIQEEVYNEIVNVLESGDPSVPVNNEHLSKLCYTEMVIKETMRLFPVGPMLGRKCTAPTRISKSTIPEGTNIILGVNNVHRNPAYWGPDANRFDPNHFLPDRIAERHPYAFLPFSGGPRNCIGYKYALMSMKIILCYLLRAYRFRSPLKLDQLQLTMSLTLKIANRNVMTVERRDN
ncbi:cytochrome P450 4C1 [Aedes aegypti]|uniref:Uncharacterized protein n=1 Tax=Aedes aegypti TaxID=7159 RepID=A0A1S4FX34_AEDAE|nr:cytochrome P450 4C1 [Aedes aegypti]